ncbi:hypothetical protein [Pseudoalteromonas mariniglutinosa]|uniref:hypothetical protein n=1 Tax=Pseudoalteromonas mariniglutinosa TaxID=206042 RepID=UPI00384CBCEA
MYRFSVVNNNLDHKPIVVLCFFIVLFFYFSLTTLLAQLVAIGSSCLIGYLTWLKLKAVHPSTGVILLEQKQLRFCSAKWQVQGTITAKSYLFPYCVCLCLQGFTGSYWLIIKSTSVQKTDLARLRRAVVSVKQAC